MAADAQSPSTLTTVTKRTAETSPMRVFSSGHPEEKSNTNVSAGSDTLPLSRHLSLSPPPECRIASTKFPLPPSSSPPPHPGLDPNFNLDSGLFTAEYPQNTTVRYKGSISLVDEDTAIAGFEARHVAEKRRQLDPTASASHLRYSSTPLPPSVLADQSLHIQTPAPTLDPNPSTLAARCAAAQERHLVLLCQRADMLEQIVRLEGEG
ncbi:hypothetical protein B0H10DRAFT_1946665 [Mycena sp. CBHHK59/15]|nr:hypothetical protein B0H10DRAFT_1946665 [Mycena sp. CBHHK59/15]